jgi:hypothetical protein
MAKVTKQGSETINEFLEQKVGNEIKFEWRGNLTEDQRSLTQDIQVYNDGSVVQIGSKNKLLEWLEFGTEQHEITPKNSPFLAFEWPDAPVEVQQMFSETFPLVFFKKVNHPGIKAYGHMRKAVGDIR